MQALHSCRKNKNQSLSRFSEQTILKTVYLKSTSKAKPQRISSLWGFFILFFFCLAFFRFSPCVFCRPMFLQQICPIYLPPLPLDRLSLFHPTSYFHPQPLILQKRGSPSFLLLLFAGYSIPIKKSLPIRKAFLRMTSTL